MAIDRELAIPTGYDPAANPRVASFAAQLDDQLASLKKKTADLEVRHLEWQPHPGVNTAGMLLAHLAVVDLWWMRLAPHDVESGEAERVMHEVLGIGMDDDGLPLARDGGHPPTLAGKSIADYYAMLDAARSVTHQELSRWRDADLATRYTRGDRVFTREWTVYHVLEHFCGHFGQILLLRHLMRDAGELSASGDR